MIDAAAPAYQYKAKLNMSKDEVTYNASIINAHRQFLKSHDEIQAIRARTAQEKIPETPPMENVSERLDKIVEELKKEMGNG
jgi:hypothetical protein